VLYRLAYLDFARGDAERALPAMTALAVNPKNPEGLRANAWLYIGRAHDLAGRREEARKAYQKVVDDFEKQRAADAARIGLLTPYRRPVK
jgi:tetratricopeptide (TPR) repeat protein